MTARKITIRTENDTDDTLILRHSELTGSLTVTTSESFGGRVQRVTLSPRQTDVMINFILRLKATLDQKAIPPAVPAEEFDDDLGILMWDETA